MRRAVGAALTVISRAKSVVLSGRDEMSGELVCEGVYFLCLVGFLSKAQCGKLIHGKNYYYSMLGF